VPLLTQATPRAHACVPVRCLQDAAEKAAAKMIAAAAAAVAAKSKAAKAANQEPAVSPLHQVCV
jgi:hypothetical protein